MSITKPRGHLCLALFVLLFLVGSSARLFSLDRLKTVEKPPSAEGGKVTIVSFYPSLGTVKDFVTLRKNKLIDIPNLSILGVYHEKELSDYKKARDFVAANHLDWFTFHPISAPLSPETLFQKNACSAEFEKIFEEADGIVFLGGPDIPPGIYGEKTSLLTAIKDPYRHYLELSFIFHLLGGFQDETFPPLLDRRPAFPVFGICLGCQSLNVGTGGTLTQDIWSESYGLAYIEDIFALGRENWHTDPFSRLAPQDRYPEFIFHPIKFDPAEKFCGKIGIDPQDQPVVFSSHHQQAKKLGKGFRIAATSLDGKVVEAIAHERYANVLGVQFHPEAWLLYDEGYRIRFSPQDKEPFSLKSYLENHPPSLAFHRKLWSWVSQAWRATHQTRNN